MLPTTSRNKSVTVEQSRYCTTHYHSHGLAMKTFLEELKESFHLIADSEFVRTATLDRNANSCKLIRNHHELTAVQGICGLLLRTVHPLLTGTRRCSVTMSELLKWLRNLDTSLVRTWLGERTTSLTSHTTLLATQPLALSK